MCVYCIVMMPEQAVCLEFVKLLLILLSEILESDSCELDVLLGWLRLTADF